MIETNTCSVFTHGSADDISIHTGKTVLAFSLRKHIEVTRHMFSTFTCANHTFFPAFLKIYSIFNLKKVSIAL